MAQHFKTFTELMEVAVLSICQEHPDWTRLDVADGLYIYQHEN